MATQATTRHREAKERLQKKGRALLERLIQAGLGTLPADQPMNMVQLQAAKVALSKILPDLKAIEHSGDDPSRTTTVKIELK